MRLTMVGTGYVGLVTGTCLANMGNHVACLDIDPSKIERLNAGRCPIYEPGLEELIARNVEAQRLTFTTDPTAAYTGAEVVFICVGTPPGAHGDADLAGVLSAARDIGRAIEADPEAGAAPHRIVVTKSTVPVGTHGLVKRAVASQTRKPFHIASNPEFLKEGQAVGDFNVPDRVVLGVEDDETGRRLRELYEPFVRQGNPILVMDIASAEMVKYAANAMLATKISFINEIAALCEHYGADIDEVRRGMCSDQRIGNRFLYPGLGYGGSCFPKDVLACIGMGRERGMDTALLSAVDAVNRGQRRLFTDKIDAHFAPGGVAGRRIAVWGLAFKPGTDDVREAPSLTVIEHLLAGGARVTAYDPAARDTARRELGDRIDYADDEMAALDAAEALVICTEWSEFRQPDFRDMKRRMKAHAIFDGRNLYRPEAMRRLGFTYISVGRSAVEPPAG